MSTFEILVGRIETLAVDAIVNAANGALIPGAGVDGAIRRAAGPALDAALESYGSLGVGCAIVTPGFNAPARRIVHTVAPVWAATDPDARDDLLADCYRSAIAAADAAGAASLAAPALGTGAFGWPKPHAAAIAVAACRAAAGHAPRLKRLIFCCFTAEDAAVYAPLVSP